MTFLFSVRNGFQMNYIGHQMTHFNQNNQKFAGVAIAAGGDISSTSICFQPPLVAVYLDLGVVDAIAELSCDSVFRHGDNFLLHSIPAVSRHCH